METPTLNAANVRSDDGPPSSTESEKENGGSSASPAAAAAADPAAENPAEDGGDGGGENQKPSRSESIRARLRAQEQRLTSLVRHTSGDEIDVIGKMRSVQQNLEQVAAEKSELEEQLERLKHATDPEDDFLKDKMAGIQEGFDKQVEKIQSLQEDVNAKNDETDSLRTELVKKLQRIVELEFDLETHEIHYTSYASDQFKLGEQALEEIKKKDGEESESASSAGDVLGVDNSSSSKTGPSPKKKAQQLISKLLTDLENLEARYKEEKLRSMSSLEQMKMENEEMRTVIAVLQQRLGETGEKTKVSLEEHSRAQLRREIETSEAKRKLLRKEADKFRAEAEDLGKESSEEAKQARLEIDLLTNDNEAMKARIAQLESKGGGLLRKKKKDDKGAKFNEIELRLKDTYGELGRLRSAVDIKDKQISTLKREVSNLRVKDISEGKNKDTLYTEFDTDLLRAHPRRINKSIGGSGHHSSSGDGDGDGADDSDYVRDLQRQLQEVQQQLVKKDQELVIERAKAASTAAGLLARITELTGKKVDGKTSKQVPIRFYT